MCVTHTHVYQPHTLIHTAPVQDHGVIIGVDWNASSPIWEWFRLGNFHRDGVRDMPSVLQAQVGALDQVASQPTKGPIIQP
jgi:hypothetical protein